MSEQIPDTATVMAVYATARDYRQSPKPSRIVTFKAWLAEHDRQTAEKAWDEGYDAGEECALTAEQDDHECIPNPYETGDRHVDQ